MSSAIDIRILKNSAEMKLIQKLEQDIWNMDPLPVHQTITAAQNGGLLLGAFFQNELVGFSYGFPGFNKGKGYLCSHMLGIHPDHQEKGVGARLKQKQKEIASEMGYDSITWTFDPLESRNAYLNLSKLNAVCSTYVENCYGDMEDSLNQGLPSDRLKVEWWINSLHVKESCKVDTKEAQYLFQWKKNEAGFPELVEFEDSIHRLPVNGLPILIPVPAYFQAIKKEDHQLAVDWRMKTRQIFRTLFAQGYTTVDILKSKDELVHYYVLVQEDKLALY